MARYARSAYRLTLRLDHEECRKIREIQRMINLPSLSEAVRNSIIVRYLELETREREREKSR